MRNRFDEELNSLNTQLINMGSLCEQAIRNATQALSDGDQGKARNVILEDGAIDQAERDIESLCFRLLLQQQPVARDLRQISAALKMITDMERIGDQASDIAEIIISAKMAEKGRIPKIDEMSQAASAMVTESVTAFVNKDLELAGRVESNDDVVDLMFESIKSRLIEEIGKGNDEIAQRSIDLIMIAKYLERIGDHATNIAEWVVFSITGVHEGGIDTKKLTPNGVEEGRVYASADTEKPEK